MSSEDEIQNIENKDEVFLTSLKHLLLNEERKDDREFKKLSKPLKPFPSARKEDRITEYGNSSRETNTPFQPKRSLPYFENINGRCWYPVHQKPVFVLQNTDSLQELEVFKIIIIKLPRIMKLINFTLNIAAFFKKKR